VLAFSDPDCAACAPVISRRSRASIELAGELEVAVITRGEPDDTHARLNGSTFANIMFQTDREMAVAFRLHSVPSATIIGPDGRIASRTVIGEEAIAQLISDHTAGASRTGSAELTDEPSPYPAGDPRRPEGALPAPGQSSPATRAACSATAAETAARTPLADGLSIREAIARASTLAAPA
jgi:hypothetical protein